MPAATEHDHDGTAQLRAHPETRTNGWLRILVVVAAAAALAFQLLAPPIVGMADNGDFSKLLGRYGLHSPAYWDYIAVRYPYEPDYYYDPGFWSSEQIFTRIALTIGRALPGDGSLDLRLMGVVHGAMFLLAVGLFVPLVRRASAGVQLVYCAAALFIFADVMYVSYLNSFYMDVSALLMLLLSAVFYLRAIAWQRRADAILFVSSSVLLISSKPQHAAWSVWIAVLVWAARGPLWGGRKPAAAAAAALVLASAWATLRFEAPPGYTANNCFNVVFFQILPNAADVNRTLAELGFDSRDRALIGKTAYAPESKMGTPAFSQAFSKKISYPVLGRFYLTHPRDAWNALRVGLDQAGRERERIGNLPRSAGQPPLAESQSFGAWSNWKRRLFYPHGARLLLTFLGVTGLVLILLATQRPAPHAGVMAGALVLAGTAMTEMLIASLADALDVVRHHLLFHAELDMLVLAALWLGMRRVGAMRAAAPSSS